MEPIKNEHFSLRTAFQQVNYKRDLLTDNLKQNDTAEISNTAKVFDKLDKFLNLGRSNRLDLDDLNDKEKEEFMKMLAELLKRGIVGYEVLESQKSIILLIRLVMKEYMGQSFIKRKDIIVIKQLH